MEPGYYYARPSVRQGLTAPFKYETCDYRPVRVMRKGNYGLKVYMCGYAAGDDPDYWEFGQRIPDYKPEEKNERPRVDDALSQVRRVQHDLPCPVAEG